MRINVFERFALTLVISISDSSFFISSFTTNVGNTSKKSFVEVPEDDRDSLQLFAFICNLSFDIYVKKQIVEKLLDNFPDLLHSEKKNSNKKDSNKDTKKKK